MGLLTRITTRLAYRIALAASMLAALFIITIGGASYFVMRSQMAENIHTVIRHNAALRAEHIGNLVGSVASTLSSLSNNALIANALVDSAGRDIYLVPFLHDLSSINGVPVTVTLTDFEGKPLAVSAQLSNEFVHSAFASRVVDTERPLVQIEKKPEGDVLIMGEPVIYGLTGRAEGAMIVQLDLASLLSDHAWSSAQAGTARLLYRDLARDAADTTPQASPTIDGTDATLQVIQPVTVGETLGSLGLAVEVTANRQMLTKPLYRLSAIYLILGFAAVLAVLLLGLGTGRRLVQPLQELERVARSVIASGSFEHRFTAAGINEVARFGELFNRMLERLSQAYMTLEQQTAALREGEQRYRAIFDSTTAAILELDFSRLRMTLTALRHDGISDLRTYLVLHPEVVQQSAQQMSVIDANPAALEIFQIAHPEDLTGPLERLLLPESYSVLQDLLVAIDQQQSLYNIEVLLRTAAGQRRQILLGAYVPDLQVKPANMLLSMLDITERKSAEQELRRTNNLLHAIGQAQSTYISATGELPESEAFSKLLDILLESTGSEYGFIGEVHHTGEGNPFLRTHAITNIAWNDESRELYENRGPRGLEFTNLKTLFGTVITSQQPVIANQPAQDPRAGGLPPGHPALEAFMGIPFVSEHKIVGMAGIANRPGGYELSQLRFLQPLTATCTGLLQAMRSDNRRRQSERALREEQQRLNTVLETAPLVLWAFDPDGRFLVSRGKGLSALGLTKDQVVGQSVFDLYHNEPEIIEDSRRALSGETVHAFHHVAKRWFDVRYEPMRDETGALCGCVGAALDVTERIEAEQALERYRKALEKQVRERTEAYEEIKRYAYIFSHDLRGPLVSAKGFVGELRLDIGELMDITQNIAEELPQGVIGYLPRLTQESIPEALGFVEAAIDKIDSLTSALLKLSRAGCREFHFETVDMQRVVAETLEALAYPIEKAGIEVVVGQLPRVWADRSGVTQVVDNLLRNAIAYLRPDTPGKILVMAEPGDGEVIFSVRDNGIGIAQDELQRIFEPFRRACAHASPGEGMGLSFVQTLVRRMGGQIWCESTPGADTIFSFTLPERPTQEIDSLND